ncbi:MAG: FAD-binding oxidoreductase [Candidatus Cloacimonadia bacterium]
MMLIIINNVLTFVGLSGVLSTIIVIADYFLANYGDCKIDINGKREITVKGGSSLLTSLAEKDIFVSSACGGRGTCGLCKVKGIDGCGPLLPTEKPYMSPKELEEGIRLSCQVKVKRDLKIEIPESIFSIRKYKSVVTAIEDYTYDIKRIEFKLIEPNEITFKAGQYVQLESKRYGKVRQPVMRAYSVSSNPSHTDYIELIIRKVPEGIMTTFTHDHLKEKDEISFTGPFGDFYIRDTGTDMFFVAGGSGMAPFKGMLEELNEKKSKRRIVFFFGARTTKDLFLLEEMKKFEEEMHDFKFIPILSHPEPNDGWDGLTGYIPPYFEEHLRDPKNTEGYLCGNPGLLNASEKRMRELGIEDIYYDSFG